MYNNVQLSINTKEDFRMFLRKTGMDCGGVEIVALSKIYRAAQYNVYFV
jgi:hypothetical protein